GSRARKTRQGLARDVEKPRLVDSLCLDPVERDARHRVGRGGEEVVHQLCRHAGAEAAHADRLGTEPVEDGEEPVDLVLAAAEEKGEPPFLCRAQAAGEGCIDQCYLGADAAPERPHVAGRERAGKDDGLQRRGLLREALGLEEEVFAVADVGRHQQQRPERGEVPGGGARRKTRSGEARAEHPRDATRSGDAKPAHQWMIFSSRTNMFAQARSISSGVIWYGIPSKLQIAIIWSMRNTGW